MKNIQDIIPRREIRCQSMERGKKELIACTCELPLLLVIMWKDMHDSSIILSAIINPLYHHIAHNHSILLTQ